MKKTMQPWALGIALVAILFPVCIALLALYASNSDANMVTDDYYEKDRRYQDRIELLQRSGALLVKPSIVVDGSAAICTVSFPDSAGWGPVEGTVRFYRNADRRSDVEKPLRTGPGRCQTFSLRGFARGYWRVQLEWRHDDKSYFHEQRSFLP